VGKHKHPPFLTGACADVGLRLYIRFPTIFPGDSQKKKGGREPNYGSQEETSLDVFQSD
jgi:hypothetical protein